MSPRLCVTASGQHIHCLVAGTVLGHRVCESDRYLAVIWCTRSYNNHGSKGITSKCVPTDINFTKGMLQQAPVSWVLALWRGSSGAISSWRLGATIGQDLGHPVRLTHNWTSIILDSPATPDSRKILGTYGTVLEFIYLYHTSFTILSSL